MLNIPWAPKKENLNIFKVANSKQWSNSSWKQNWWCHHDANSRKKQKVAKTTWRQLITNVTNRKLLRQHEDSWTQRNSSNFGPHYKKQEHVSTENMCEKRGGQRQWEDIIGTPLSWHRKVSGHKLINAVRDRKMCWSLQWLYDRPFIARITS